MKINSVNKNSFGKLYIQNIERTKLMADILNSSASAKEYRNALADMLEISADPNVIVKISKNNQGQARITVHHKAKGSTSTRYFSQNWTKQFLQALEEARSDRYKRFFKKVQERKEL